MEVRDSTYDDDLASLEEQYHQMTRSAWSIEERVNTLFRSQLESEVEQELNGNIDKIGWLVKQHGLKQVVMVNRIHDDRKGIRFEVEWSLAARDGARIRNPINVVAHSRWPAWKVAKLEDDAIADLVIPDQLHALPHPHPYT